MTKKEIYREKAENKVELIKTQLLISVFGSALAAGAFFWVYGDLSPRIRDSLIVFLAVFALLAGIGFGTYPLYAEAGKLFRKGK